MTKISEAEEKSEYRSSSSSVRFFSPPSPAEEFCSEAVFQEKLLRERQRTDRTGRPFLLMQIGLESLLKKESTKSAKDLEHLEGRLIAGVCSPIRQTDIAGWFASCSVIGVIYTEIDKEKRFEIREKLLTRVRKQLAEILGPELSAVHISFQCYPMDFDPEQESSFKLYFSPEAKREKGGKSLSLMIKRVFDIVGSLGGLLFFLPCFFVLPILIKKTSPGPVFFRQTRLGLNGKPFVFLKFRSMRVDNDPTIHQEFIKALIEKDPASSDTSSMEQEQVYKIQSDPRVTPIGHFLRKTSLDEIPQFLNVLRGEMSLIGPRPPIPYELEHYQSWHRRRIMEVKPGITGLWQVKGRSSCSFDEMVRLDLQYSREWSLWLDLKILLQTPWVMIAGKGAY